MTTSFFTKCKNKIVNLEHDAYLLHKRKRLRNLDPTIISNNCVGGVIYHDLGLKFCSPTINLFFEAEDFLKFAKNLKYYLSLELREEQSDRSYPVGRIGDVKLYFMHYKSFEEAKAKWEERSRRVHYDNLFFIMTEREGCTAAIAQEFDKLPYQNKVLLTHVPMPQIRCAYHLPGFENCQEMGTVTDCRNSFWRRRYIDAFDYVRFFNTGLIN